MVKNIAARVLCPTLKQLHWLPVEFRIKYKICLLTLTFNALNGRDPQYMSEMLISRNVHYGLRSREALTLNIPRTERKTLGDRAFEVSAPKLRNSLPEDVRSSDDVSVSVLKSKLKTHYFSIVYN